MKHLIILGSLITIMAACQNNVTNNPKEPVDPNAKSMEEQAKLMDSTNWTTVEWLDAVQNFGKVTDGEKVLITFHFKNTGTKPLIIAGAQASCGCTVPSKPEAPIPPGGEGEIKAEFNSSGRVGKATKNITVTCNTRENSHTLVFEGDVLPKK